MSCYHPLIASVDVDDFGKKHLHFLPSKYSPDLLKYQVDCGLEIPKRLEDGSFGKIVVPYQNLMKIPCGKCIGCKFDYTKQWADRMIMELFDNDGKGVFVTLTYNNDHVPFAVDEDGLPVSLSLQKRDFQLFMKRLRKHFSDKSIRFFACGEYGRTLRPHYHAIIFGISLSDFPDLVVHGMNELNQLYFVSQTFTDIWSNGFTLLADVSYKTCAYVARYNVKKAYGDNVKPHELAEDSFVLMSRRPGIASRFYDFHPDFFDTMSAYFADSNGSVRVSCPTYFLNKLSIDNPEKYANIVRERRQLSKERELLRLARSDLSYPEQLEIEENDVLRRTKSILFERSDLSHVETSD